MKAFRDFTALNPHLQSRIGAN